MKIKRRNNAMKIKMLEDCEVEVWETEEESTTELFKKDTILDVDYVGDATSFAEEKFPQFQNGDGSVFILTPSTFEEMKDEESN
jgi:hypothetical protein